MRRHAAAAAEGIRFLVTERTLRELQGLNLCTSTDLPDMSYKQEISTFVEYVCAITSEQLLMRSGGEKKTNIA